MAILENIDIDIDIDKGILQNIDIDKISYRLGFGISNPPTYHPLPPATQYTIHTHNTPLHWRVIIPKMLCIGLDLHPL